MAGAALGGVLGELGEVATHVVVVIALVVEPEEARDVLVARLSRLVGAVEEVAEGEQVVGERPALEGAVALLDLGGVAVLAQVVRQVLHAGGDVPGPGAGEDAVTIAGLAALGVLVDRRVAVVADEDRAGGVGAVAQGRLALGEGRGDHEREAGVVVGEQPLARSGALVPVAHEAFHAGAEGEQAAAVDVLALLAPEPPLVHRRLIGLEEGAVQVTRALVEAPHVVVEEIHHGVLGVEARDHVGGQLLGDRRPGRCGREEGEKHKGQGSGGSHDPPCGPEPQGPFPVSSEREHEFLLALGAARSRERWQAVPRPRLPRACRPSIANVLGKLSR